MRAFPRSVPAVTLATIPAVILGTALLAGCGGHDEHRAPVADDTPASTPPPTTSTTPTTSGPAPETTAPTSPPPVTSTDRLLATADVPGLNARWHWQDGRTGPAGAQPFGVCAKGSLADIGATEVVERSYFPPDDSDDNAGEQVAVFPDAKTTALAWSVLGSWHDKCGRLAAANPGLKVRPFTTVAAGDQARWYLLSWSPADDEAGRFETLGMVRSGTTIAVLRITHSGPDHNYPAGQDPMDAMVKAAAARLG